MVTYKVTRTGPKGFQVTAITRGAPDALVGDFWSELLAEAFAEKMRQIDGDILHSSNDKRSA